MVTVLEQWVSWGVMVLAIVWLFWAEVSVLCGGSYWSGTTYGLWSGVSDVSDRSGECRMGCGYVCWCHGMSGGMVIYQSKGDVHCCGGCKRSMRCLLKLLLLLWWEWQRDCNLLKCHLCLGP